MQIVIPMSGQGTRFLKAGYTIHKALIEVDGMPIIEHIVNMFSPEDQFFFICDENHLKNTEMSKILKRIVPNSKIVSIKPHNKGPVHATAAAFDFINDNDEVIVNYCDFGTFWDYQNFLHHTRSRQADGAIVAYKGFHPHMLGPTNYAFIQESNQWMSAIKEKEPFTNNRNDEFASNGTYYFKSGAIVKKYFRQLIDENIHINNEYYVSLVYNLLQKDNLKISIYEIEHMLQWGTPEDLDLYQKWSQYFNFVTNYKKENQQLNYSLIMPMAGNGQRFKDVGYHTPKPFINVNGMDMFRASLAYLSDFNDYHIITRTEFREHLKNENHNIHYVKTSTQGQADSVSIALENMSSDSAFLVLSCDSGIIFKHGQIEEFSSLGCEAICFVFRNHHHALANPHMYGWIRSDKENIQAVSVKSAVGGKIEESDMIMTGAFWFKSKKQFLKYFQKLKTSNKQTNNEFYVDSIIKEMVEDNVNVRSIQVEHYISWGTPDDLKTYEYWQSYFHKSKNHPYSIDEDPFFNPKEVSSYKSKFYSFAKDHNLHD